jgi:hypothetical protein
MYLFLIEFVLAFGYLLAASGVRKIFENLADSNWQLAISRKKHPKTHRRGRRCHTILVGPYAK